MSKTIFPIAVISVCILIIWYGFSIILNSSWAFDKAERNEAHLTFFELVDDTWSQKKRFFSRKLLRNVRSFIMVG
jgi:NitT/TauT family transport system permease protein